MNPPDRIGFAFDAALGPDIARAVAPVVEDLDYASLWTNDVPTASGLEVLAAAQPVTRRIALGVGVIPCSRRSASEIAAAVRELRLDERRAVVGVGSGQAEPPVPAVRAAATDLRRLLGREVRVAVAAMGPLMCRLAGEIGDVALLNWMTPERIRWARERVREGERRAGRAAGSCSVAAYVRVAVGEGAARRLAEAAARYARMPAYARSFEAMGVEPATVGVAAADAADVLAALAPYREALDETIVRALPATDDAEGVLAVARVELS